MNVSTAVAPPPRILIADADDDARALYRHGVFSGYDVVEVSDGRDALAHALACVPSLVLTEITLPFLNGFALCEILRRDLLTRDVPIVVITSESRPAELEHARRSGADRILVKPTPLEPILSEVRRFLAHSIELRARSAAVGPKAAEQFEASARLFARSEQQRRKALSKAHARFDTTAPPTPPPALVCPSCDRLLTYERSHVGGVSDRHPEQWDYYVCPASCGTFQYRQRTRKLRPI
jgi:two-component system chemotaxis response regulator CheY